MPTTLRIRRRSLLAGAATTLAFPAGAQPGSGASAPITVAQIYDASAGEQDVAKDFLIGSRAAWQDINARGGLRGRPVQHVSLPAEAPKVRASSTSPRRSAWQTSSQRSTRSRS